MTKSPSITGLSPAGNASAPQASAGGRFGRARTLIFAGGCLGLLAVGAGVAWVTGIIPGSLFSKSSVHAPLVVYMEIPEIITNLQGKDGEQPYIKMKVALQVASNQDKIAIEKKIPQFVDMCQTFVRSMQSNELQGANGTYRLKEALIARANVIASPIRVQDVLFQEIIVQ